MRLHKPACHRCPFCRDRRAISRNPESSGPTRLWSSKIPGSPGAQADRDHRVLLGHHKGHRCAVSGETASAIGSVVAGFESEQASWITPRRARPASGRGGRLAVG